MRLSHIRLRTLFIQRREIATDGDLDHGPGTGMIDDLSNDEFPSETREDQKQGSACQIPFAERKSAPRNLTRSKRLEGEVSQHSCSNLQVSRVAAKDMNLAGRQKTQAERYLKVVLLCMATTSVCRSGTRF